MKPKDRGPLKSPAEIEGRRARLEALGYPVNKKQIAAALGVGSHPDSGRVVVSDALRGRAPMPDLLRRIDQFLDQIESSPQSTGA